MDNEMDLLSSENLPLDLGAKVVYYKGYILSTRWFLFDLERFQANQVFLQRQQEGKAWHLNWRPRRIAW